jgi:hypothetical protein
MLRLWCCSVWVTALAAGVMLSACGSQQSAPANNATVAPPASPMTQMQKEVAALPLSQQAPIPAGLHCEGSIVWVNTARKTYHEQGDPYFGRTKHGQYMCQAAADAAGYHLAGSRHHKMGRSRHGAGTGAGAENGDNGSGMATPTP